MQQYRTFNGKQYKRRDCGLTKTEATRAAKSWRESGQLARIVQDKNTWCVFVRIPERNRMKGFKY